MNRFISLAALVFVPVAAVGCIIVEDDPPRRVHGSDVVYVPGDSTGSSGSTGGATTDTASPSPMLVVVDTGQTMTADPGQGVGVFIEYAAGGTWHLWWTCDTAKTNQDCDFTVGATAAQGTIGSINAQELAGGSYGQPNASRIEATTKTSSETHGITFTTTAGAVLTVDAKIGGVQDGSFLFFVQDGKVNGGYTGKLTNPLQLQGNAP
jgi:hypothetical protein